MTQKYKFVNYSWDDAKAASLDPAGRLVYRSNILGADQRITNTGGGNTSSKIMEKDPLTGEQVEVLWVKGLRRRPAHQHPREFLLALPGQAHRPSENLRRDEPARAEDGRGGRHGRHVFPHNFQPEPARQFHRHAAALFHPVQARRPHAPERRDLGRRRPQLGGADQGNLRRRDRHTSHGCVRASSSASRCRKSARSTPRPRRIIMGQHGFINWDDDDKACYELHSRLHRKGRGVHRRQVPGEGRRRHGVRRPEIQVARGRPAPGRVREDTAVAARAGVPAEALFVGTMQDDEAILRFVNSTAAPRLAELGTSCPDHFLRTKIKPLYVEWNPADAATSTALKKLLGERPRRIPPGLRRVLRTVQARRTRPRCATRTRRSSSSPASA